jgi:hypothetical protein
MKEFLLTMKRKPIAEEELTSLGEERMWRERKGERETRRIHMR